MGSVDPDVYAALVAQAEDRLLAAERRHAVGLARLPEYERQHAERADAAIARRAQSVRLAAFKARARAGHPFKHDHDHNPEE